MFFFNNQQDPQEFCFKIYILFQKNFSNPNIPLGHLVFFWLENIPIGWRITPYP